jgi:hypothetical protein
MFSKLLTIEFEVFLTTSGEALVLQKTGQIPTLDSLETRWKLTCKCFVGLQNDCIVSRQVGRSLLSVTASSRSAGVD